MKKKSDEKKRAEQERVRRIRNYYDCRILQTKTVRDCEDILRELAKDQEIPSSEYWNVYWELEARARMIKKHQQQILEETAAAIKTAEKMTAHIHK